MRVEIKKYNHIYRYEKDNTNSFHRILTDAEKKRIISFYKNHFYLDHKWECRKTIKSINEKELVKKKQQENSQMQDVFKILKEWELIHPKQKPADILDIGCGAGIFIKEWEKQEYGIGYGIELSNIAKDVSPEIKIQFLDVNLIQNAQIRNDIYLVVALDVIEHLFKVSNFLNAIFLKISNGTKMLIDVPIIPDNTTIEELKKYKYFYPSRHLHLYTQEGFKKEIEASKFRILNFKIRKSNTKMLILVEKQVM